MSFTESAMCLMRAAMADAPCLNCVGPQCDSFNAAFPLRPRHPEVPRVCAASKDGRPHRCNSRADSSFEGRLRRPPQDDGDGVTAQPLPDRARRVLVWSQMREGRVMLRYKVLVVLGAVFVCAGDALAQT